MPHEICSIFKAQQDNISFGCDRLAEPIYVEFFKDGIIFLHSHIRRISEASPKWKGGGHKLHGNYTITPSQWSAVLLSYQSSIIPVIIPVQDGKV